MFNALEAAKQLEADGISAEVINAASIKPLDEDAAGAARRARTGHVVTVEDHAIAGGLGGAVAERSGEVLPTPLKRLGVTASASPATPRASTPSTASTPTASPPA